MKVVHKNEQFKFYLLPLDCVASGIASFPDSEPLRTMKNSAALPALSLCGPSPRSAI